MTARTLPAGAHAAPRRQPHVRASLPAGTGATYCRARDLPRLLALWPDEIKDLSPAAHVRLVAKLRAALRAERRRGLSGHWTYDLARHRQLLAAYRAEHALLDCERAARRVKRPSRAVIGKEDASYFSRRVPRPIFLARSERACA